jgi:hypothetical protein
MPVHQDGDARQAVHSHHASSAEWIYDQTLRIQSHFRPRAPDIGWADAPATLHLARKVHTLHLAAASVSRLHSRGL